MKKEQKLRPYFFSMLIMAVALVHFSFSRAGAQYDGLRKAQQGEHATDKQHEGFDLGGLSELGGQMQSASDSQSANFFDQEVIGIQNEIILRGRTGFILRKVGDLLLGRVTFE